MLRDTSRALWLSPYTALLKLLILEGEPDTEVIPIFSDLVLVGYYMIASASYLNNDSLAGIVST